MFLVPHKFEDTYVMFVVKASVDNLLDLGNANVVTPFFFKCPVCKQCTQTTYRATVSDITVNCCREFDDDAKWTGANVPCLSPPIIARVSSVPAVVIFTSIAFCSVLCAVHLASSFFCSALL